MDYTNPPNMNFPGQGFAGQSLQPQQMNMPNMVYANSNPNQTNFTGPAVYSQPPLGLQQPPMGTQQSPMGTQQPPNAYKFGPNGQLQPNTNHQNSMGPRGVITYPEVRSWAGVDYRHIDGRWTAVGPTPQPQRVGPQYQQVPVQPPLQLNHERQCQFVQEMQLDLQRQGWGVPVYGIARKRKAVDPVGQQPLPKRQAVASTGLVPIFPYPTGPFVPLPKDLDFANLDVPNLAPEVVEAILFGPEPIPAPIPAPIPRPVPESIPEPIPQPIPEPILEPKSVAPVNLAPSPSDLLVFPKEAEPEEPPVPMDSDDEAVLEENPQPVDGWSEEDEAPPPPKPTKKSNNKSGRKSGEEKGKKGKRDPDEEPEPWVVKDDEEKQAYIKRREKYLQLQLDCPVSLIREYMYPRADSIYAASRQAFEEGFDFDITDLLLDEDRRAAAFAEYEVTVDVQLGREAGELPLSGYQRKAAKKRRRRERIKEELRMGAERRTRGEREEREDDANGCGLQVEPERKADDDDEWEKAFEDCDWGEEEDTPQPEPTPVEPTPEAEAEPFVLSDDILMANFDDEFDTSSSDGG